MVCRLQPQTGRHFLIGFDKPRSLGGAETGAQAALPIWMSYMGKALKDVPEQGLSIPEGVVMVNVDPATGQPAADGKDSIPEYFYQENLPSASASWAGGSGAGKSPEEIKDQLF